MTISSTMDVRELAQYMGQDATDAEAAAMRDVLVDRGHDGRAISEVCDSEWLAMLRESGTRLTDRRARIDEEIAGGTIPSDLTIEDVAIGHADYETAQRAGDAALLTHCAVANLVHMTGDVRGAFPAEGLEAEIAQRLGLSEAFRAAWREAHDVAVLG